MINGLIPPPGFGNRRPNTGMGPHSNAASCTEEHVRRVFDVATGAVRQLTTAGVRRCRSGGDCVGVKHGRLAVAGFPSAMSHCITTR